MAIELLCRKIGMTRTFNEAGEALQVTVLEAGPNAVLQKKTPAKDGYAALQLGFRERSRKNVGKPMLGHFEKAGTSPRWHIKESRVEAEELESYEVGQELKADLFEAGQKIDAIGTSRGRGTAGTVKRHNYKVKRRTHGTHESHRHGGSIGAGAYPGKVIKGMGMFGRYGDERTTVRNLEVVSVDAEQNLILIRGGIPGHPNSLIRIRAAKSPK
ncbi:MAG: 50S ribosomal protein L3 [Myxococcota bacterium]